MRLAKSPVIYDREVHTYTLDGVRLNGVTEMIKWQLHPESYVGIPDEVLATAATKGSWVHDMCETFDNFGDIPNEDNVESFRHSLEERGYSFAEVEEQVSMMRNAIVSANEYKKLVEKKGHVCEASEYVVTDRWHFASPIDKVYKVDEGTVDIYDIKTVSTMDKAALEKVAWQCSIYAAWFEAMNPDIKVRNIGLIWLPDKKYWTKSKFPVSKVLERIPVEEVKALLDAEVGDRAYREGSVRRSDRKARQEVVKVDESLPAEIASMKAYVVDTLKLFKAAEERKKEMLDKVKDAMGKFNIKSWSTDEFSFTQAADSERKTFDIKAFEAAHPEIDLAPYYKTTHVKGGFTAKTK